ncbi:MAG: lmo0937 family membrane protein [Chryseobacterium sp.]|nr:lmo0937 family membrane protein [Chryseobacterium sp.]
MMNIKAINIAMEKILLMKYNIFYILSVILFISWVVGYIIFDVGGMFHFAFLLAVIILLLKLIRDHTR